MIERETTVGFKMSSEPEDNMGDNIGDMDDEEWFEFFEDFYGVSMPEKGLAEKLYKFVPPVFLIIATIGNLLSAIVLHSMYKKVLSSCQYLFVACFVDTLGLFILCGNEWHLHVTGFDVRQKAMFSSNSLCKIFPFVESFLTHISIWLLVAIVIETTIVVLKVEKLLKVYVLERARAVILLIIVLLVCINAHCFWSFSLQDEEEKKEIKCSNFNRQGSYASAEFRKVVWPIMDILITNFFPYFIIFACTVILITRKVKRTDRSREAVNIWKTYHLDGSSAREFQISIIVICILYLVLMVPKFANDIFVFLVDQNGLAMVPYSVPLSSKMILAECICDFLHYSFLSFKFIVYVSTSKKFRDELCLLLTCQRCSRSQHPRPQRLSPTRNSTLYEPANTALVNNEIVPNDVHGTPISLRSIPREYKTLPSQNHCNSLEKRPFAITSV